MLQQVKQLYEFRNTQVAHHEKDLRDKVETETQLKLWIEVLGTIRLRA